MKKLLLFIVLFAVASSFTFAQAEKSKLVTSKMKSEILGVEKEYTIFLPPGYETSGVDYPILYLLHGAWGNHQSWATNGNMQNIATSAIIEGLTLPMVIVMPDASGVGENFGGKNMGYFNLEGWSYEDYFFKEFMPYIEKNYRVVGDKRHRAIAGLSMGGGGTTVYAQHHPELFSSACTLSGLVGMVDDRNAGRLGEEFTRVALATCPVDYVLNATPAQVDALRTVRWWSDCGDDDYLAKGNVDFYLAMLQKKIPLQYRMRDGAHKWEYWQSALPVVMQYISIGFAELPRSK